MSATRNNNPAPDEGAFSRPTYVRGTPDRARAEAVAAKLGRFDPRRATLLRALALVDKLAGSDRRTPRDAEMRLRLREMRSDPDAYFAKCRQPGGWRPNADDMEDA